MNRQPAVLLKKGTLRDRLTRATKRALEIGALLPVPTDYEFIEDGGVKFFVRILTSLARKDEERKKREKEAGTGRAVNPFLPYEDELFVADVSQTHVAILNKFNVVEDHLLVVTREFEHQDMLLTLADFEALWACLLEYESLGFYNGGEAAGASQAHKHLQVVPLPLSPEGPAVPAEPLFASAQFEDGIGTVQGFPFLNVFVRLDSDSIGSIKRAAETTLALYGRMLLCAEMSRPAPDRPERQSGPYCLLVTREWMLLVPRSQEFFEGISINSLGYAGCLLVRNEEQMDILKKSGPMTALRHAAREVKKR